MPNLYQITAKRDLTDENLKNGEIASVVYHDIFDYPLTIPEMIKWRANDNLFKGSEKSVANKEGYFFIEGKEGIIYKRVLKRRISERKIAKACEASKILSILPNIRMVAVTGSLAMKNSGEDGDIDLMVITKSGRLWTTRFLSLLMLKLSGFKVRKAGDPDQKDKLCLNIWLDESDIVWKKGRNIYTAHEIAQIIPLVNKNGAYERFISQNSWIKKFWPNSVKVSRKTNNREFKYNFNIFEMLAFKIQYLHMRNKITKETVTKTKALFHPQNWSEIVVSRFSS